MWASYGNIIQFWRLAHSENGYGRRKNRTLIAHPTPYTVSTLPLYRPFTAVVDWTTGPLDHRITGGTEGPPSCPNCPP